MDEEQRNRIEEAVAEWQKRLGLQHWDIEVREEVLDEDTVAQMRSYVGRYKAFLVLAEAFFIYTPREQSECIAHELIHLTQARMQDQLRSLTRNVSFDLSRAIVDLVNIELEYMTDKIAQLLARALPIPNTLTEGDEE